MGMNEKEYFIRKFDEYTDLSLEDEKARSTNDEGRIQWEPSADYLRVLALLSC